MPEHVDDQWMPTTVLWTPPVGSRFSMTATVASGCHEVGNTRLDIGAGARRCGPGVRAGGPGQAWASTRTVSSKTTPPISSTGTV
jgi:hypothetical protein